MAGVQVHVRIALVKVCCKDTADRLGGDSLYIAGGVICDGHRTAVLTYPFAASEDHTVSFARNEAVLFQSTVRSSDTLHVGLAAYRENFTKDWGKNYRPILKAMTGTVDAMPSDGADWQLTDACERVRTEFADVFGTDVLLGALTFCLPVSGLHAGEKLWSVKGSSGMGNWDYAVIYRIGKAAVPE
ncbi:hypothetical protein RB200_07015 [Streptomyces sp. PmtG]